MKLTRDDVVRVLAYLADQYRDWGRNCTGSMADSWLLTLGDCEPATLLTAAVAHARSSKFPPTPADLLARCRADQTPAGEAAFDLASRAARYASPHDEKRCSEAWRALRARDAVAADACREFGGFRAFWDLETDAIGTARAHFARIYSSLAAKARAAAELEDARLVLNFAALPPMLRPGPDARGGEPRRISP